MLSSYGHAVPVIGGQLQRTGADARAAALRADFRNEEDTLVLDIGSAYAAPELKRRERTFVFRRGESAALTVRDEAAFSEPKRFETVLITWGNWNELSEKEGLISGRGGAGQLIKWWQTAKPTRYDGPIRAHRRSRTRSCGKDSFSAKLRKFTMKKSILLAVSALLLGSFSTGRAVVVSGPVSEAARKEWLRRLIPLPHEIGWTHAVDLPTARIHVRFRARAGEIETHAARQLAATLGITATNAQGGDSFEILIGVCDGQGRLDGLAVPDFQRLARLPNHQQAYLIRPAGESRLVLTALDERGVCYASRTLCQLLEHGRHEDRLILPLVSVTDWPDIEERGTWGTPSWAILDFPAIAAYKMNLAELHATELKVLPDGRGSASFSLPELKAARLNAMNVVPIITHFDLLKRTGLFEVVPATLARRAASEPKGDDAQAFPCASQSRFVDVLADWMEGLAKCEGLTDITVWLSENNVQCACDLCREAGQFVQETRAIVTAWERVHKKHPHFRLRILLTQGSYSTNGKVLAEIPKNVGVTYYHGGLTSDSSRRPMIYPLLEQFAAGDRWLGCYPQLTASWRVVCPWTGPQFVKARMTEFASKKLRCVCGYATPDPRLYDFNLTAAAEWSWNANGRDEREFAAAWATRRGFGDPDQVADWAVTLGPISWDVYGSGVPYPAFFRVAANMIEKRVKPGLGTGMFLYFPTREHLDRDLAGVAHALELARRIKNQEILQETLVIQGYLRMLREIYEIAAVACQGGPLSDAGRNELKQGIERLTEAGRQTATALEAWEASIKPSIGRERFKDTVNVTRETADKIARPIQSLLAPQHGPATAPAKEGVER